MGSCAAPSAKGDDKFITTDYLQQCQFMYQDYENFPSGMASEYGFNWAYVEGYRLAREEGCEDAWYAWVSNTGDTCFEQFREAWLGGPYDSELEFAAQYVDECGFLSEVPDTVARY
ncbi:antirestriction protein ArdA, partial [Escherichia coli]|nr:antirestriction protein ArdA [Escherichia coli]